jgi:hypothetical protein
MECEKLGEVKNIKVFERNPEGVFAVKFADHPPAARCIEVENTMHNEWILILFIIVR